MSMIIRSALAHGATRFAAAPAGPAPPTIEILGGATVSVQAGGTRQLGLSLGGFPAPSVSWESSNDSVATVSESGMVTAGATGTAVITATAVNSEGIAADTINVVVQAVSGVAPALVEDFDYPSTANFITDPRGIYHRSEDILGSATVGEMVIDPTEGYGGRSSSLRYNWFGHGAPAHGGTLSRAFRLGALTEVWVEWSAKFSSNYQLDNGYTGGAAYKFVHVNINGAPGRFEITLEGAQGPLSFAGPGDVYDQTHRWTGLSLTNDLGGNVWHVYRVHCRLTPTADMMEMWVDGVHVGVSSGWNSVASSIWACSIGKNHNMAPLHDMQNWWGHFHFWTQNPGW